MTPLLRAVVPADAGEWSRLRYALWPEADPPHETEVRDWLANPPADQAVFVLDIGSTAGDQLGGFLEASLRTLPDGRGGSQIGYIEGWYVIPALRGQGFGRALVQAAEAWARARGCSEMGSDTELSNLDSQEAHLALGYAEVERLVCFRKQLGQEPAPGAGGPESLPA